MSKAALKLKPHPAADLFPVMTEDRYQELLASIKANGLRVPIVLADGKVLDGRNRYRACVELGIEPKTREFAGGNPFDYVWDLNGARRDLDPAQRVAIRDRLNEASAEWDAKQRRELANKKRSEAAKEQPRSPKDDGRVGFSGRVSGDTRPEPDPTNWERTQLAQQTGASSATASRIIMVRNHSKDLRDQIADGKIQLTEAVRQVKRERLKEKSLEPLPSDTYRVLYADPPWQYNDSRTGLEDYRKTAASDHYPTMSLSELQALEVKSRADNDSVLFCWATFPLLPTALELVRSWGFKYKTAFVWYKGRPNFGHYHNASAELLLVCTRGSCTPEREKRFDQVQTVKSGRHSEKPEHFREMIDELYPTGKRLELFARAELPERWDAWGNES